MHFLGIISESLLYLCFSILIGSFLLSIFPSTYRPAFRVSKGFLMAATVGIAILSFVPVLQIILYLYEDIGFTATFTSVLFTFEVGKAWIFTYLVANVLFIYIVWFDYRKKAWYALIGIALTFILILALGWSGHASSYDPVWGFINHTVHFTAVSVWVGILLVVSWFSTNHSNWFNFLKWFSPVAIICFVTTMLSGLYLMTIVVDYKDYMNSWMLPYGQALLIKHLLIIPLIVYAFINSVFVRKELNRNVDFNPIRWTKAESLVVFLIFAATAALGQQEPPHDIRTTLASSGVSKLFDLFYQGTITRDSIVLLGLNFNNMMLLIIALLFLGLIIASYIKRTSNIFSFTMSVLLVFTVYLSLIVSIR
ncbi:CopD family protein [Niallia sp. XMNu-256]|uniref:copper resistance D family protein n=1 Tax=Niallia sp. XMNu-256 TaxID=3082444 RepID=UPI0030CC9C95